MLTDNHTKHAMSTMLNTMLRERRVHVAKDVVSTEPKACLVRYQKYARWRSSQASTRFSATMRSRRSFSSLMRS